METRRRFHLALLTSAALILFLIELRLPPLFPIPGAKLGLANIVTVYAVYRFPPAQVLLMLLTRIFLGAFFAGQLTVLFYSLSGGLCCFAVSFCLRSVISENRLPLASAAGAVSHNTGQLAAAALLLGTPAVLAWSPYLLGAGLITGLFTGLCARQILRRLSFPIL